MVKSYTCAGELKLGGVPVNAPVEVLKVAHDGYPPLTIAYVMPPPVLVAWNEVIVVETLGVNNDETAGADVNDGITAVAPTTTEQFVLPINLPSVAFTENRYVPAVVNVPVNVNTPTVLIVMAVIPGGKLRNDTEYEKVGLVVVRLVAVYVDENPAAPITLLKVFSPATIVGDCQ
jgi:hypothetical protein